MIRTPKAFRNERKRRRQNKLKPKLRRYRSMKNLDACSFLPSENFDFKPSFTVSFCVFSIINISDSAGMSHDSLISNREILSKQRRYQWQKVLMEWPCIESKSPKSYQYRPDFLLSQSSKQPDTATSILDLDLWYLIKFWDVVSTTNQSHWFGETSLESQTVSGSFKQPQFSGNTKEK